MIALTLNHILYCIVCWTLSFYFSLSLFKDLHFNYIYLYSYFSTLRIWGSLRRLGCLLYHNKNFAAWLWRITNSNVILAVLIRYVYNMFQLEQTPFNRIPHLSQIPERERWQPIYSRVLKEFDSSCHCPQEMWSMWVWGHDCQGCCVHCCSLQLTPTSPLGPIAADMGRYVFHAQNLWII